MSTPTAQSILNAGLGHMQDRAATYDKPEGVRSMGATVAAFNAVTGLTLTTEQGWLFQILLKAVRSQQGAFRLDCYEDGAAYFGLMGEAAAVDRLQVKDTPVSEMIMPVDLAKVTTGDLQVLLKAAEFDEKRAVIIGVDMAKGEDVGATVTGHTEGGRLVVDEVKFDEKRADAIGQNGNDGEHYDAIEQEESRQFRQMADRLTVPAPVPRRSPDPKPRPAPVVLPDTDKLVDSTGRPKWSDLPKWVQWLGQDRKGVWTGFAAKPEPRAGRWVSSKRFIELNSGEPLIGENWTHMLEERP